MLQKTIAGRRMPFVVVGAFLLSLVTPVAAQAPVPAMLDTLDKGRWEVRYRESGERTRICVRSGQELVQLRHGAAPGCSLFVVEDGRDTATVQYTCRGNGYGRTYIRRENASLAQIDSQGIHGGMPFAFTAEARRIGTCG